MMHQVLGLLSRLPREIDSAYYKLSACFLPSTELWCLLPHSVQPVVFPVTHFKFVFLIPPVPSPFSRLLVAGFLSSRSWVPIPSLTSDHCFPPCLSFYSCLSCIPPPAATFQLQYVALGTLLSPVSSLASLHPSGLFLGECPQISFLSFYIFLLAIVPPTLQGISVFSVPAFLPDLRMDHFAQ